MYLITDLLNLFFFFFFKQKTAYEMLRSLVGSEMCIRDSNSGGTFGSLHLATVGSVCDNTTVSSMHSDTQEADEDDEDIIFRVVAQRVAPAIRKVRPSAGVAEEGYTTTVDRDSKGPLSPSMTSGYRLDNIIVTDHESDAAHDKHQPQHKSNRKATNSPHRTAFVHQSPLTPAGTARVDFATYSPSISSAGGGGGQPQVVGGAPRNRSMSSFPAMGLAMNSTSTSIAQLIDIKSVGSSNALDQHQHQYQQPHEQQ
eukprot:TRINITY_DN3191_c0_g1_i1.p1 TRINITY_DN3191_c0_g1~~TRINITY_DN3191_c0_g1_i1.p1  ORF type:complete len:255 (+),score=62.80 TRINITY_DN3191_c0_g1_i1:86-850(+)